MHNNDNPVQILKAVRTERQLWFRFDIENEFKTAKILSDWSLYNLVTVCVFCCLARIYYQS